MEGENYCGNCGHLLLLNNPTCINCNYTTFPAKSQKDVVSPESLREGYKADEDKVRLDLIPAEVLIALGALYTMGAKKYADNNWRKGLRYGQCYAAMQRHALAFWNGENIDPDGQHHLTSVAWNALTLLYFELHKDEYGQFDDRWTTKYPKALTLDNELPIPKPFFEIINDCTGINPTHVKVNIAGTTYLFERADKYKENNNE